MYNPTDDKYIKCKIDGSEPSELKHSAEDLQVQLNLQAKVLILPVNTKFLITPQL